MSKQAELDTAFNAGRKAYWNKQSRMANPFLPNKRDLQNEWYSGWDNGQREAIQQNAKFSKTSK